MAWDAQNWPTVRSPGVVRREPRSDAATQGCGVDSVLACCVRRRRFRGLRVVPAAPAAEQCGAAPAHTTLQCAGLTRVLLTYYEAGCRQVPVSAAAALARLYGTSLEALLASDESHGSGVDVSGMLFRAAPRELESGRRPASGYSSSDSPSTLSWPRKWERRCPGRAAVR